MIVTLVQGAGSCSIWSLTIERLYPVIAIEADHFRIVDDTGELYLYKPGCFEVTDSREPSSWVSKRIDGLRYASPPEWSRAGFFEDYFDRDEEARAVFLEVYDRVYGVEA